MSKYHRSSSIVKHKTDDYESSPKILDQILDELDATKVSLWEPFVSTGFSSEYMKSKGFEVIENEFSDFFMYEQVPVSPTNKTVVLLTNAPFRIKKKVLRKISELKVQHFAILLPIGTILLKYFDKLFNCDDIQLILHKGRPVFLDPITHNNVAGSTSFDVAWVTLNLKLGKDLYFK